MPAELRQRLPDFSPSSSLVCGFAWIGRKMYFSLVQWLGYGKTSSTWSLSLRFFSETEQQTKSKQYTYTLNLVYLDWARNWDADSRSHSHSHSSFSTRWLPCSSGFQRANYEMLSRKRKVARATHTTLQSAPLPSPRTAVDQKSRRFPPVQMLNCRHLVCNCKSEAERERGEINLCPGPTFGRGINILIALTTPK